MCMVDMMDGRADAYTERVRRAIKPHTCCECGRDIAKGEHYEHTSGIWDGEPMRFKTCAGCVWARQWLNNNCGGWIFTAVLEDLQEHRMDGYRNNMLLLRIRGMERNWPDGYLEACKAKEQSRKETP